MYRSAFSLLLAVGLTLTLGVAGNTNLCAAEPDLSQFPKLEGKLTHMLGHEGGFLRPKVGETFQFDFNKLGELEKLEFGTGESKNYIPLPSPLSVKRIDYYGNGAFQSMRLVSQSEKQPTSRVVMDISPGPGMGKGANHVLIWVIIERLDLVRGVALIEVKADGDFPGKKK